MRHGIAAFSPTHR